jgi:hypothetical protein
MTAFVRILRYSKGNERVKDSLAILHMALAATLWEAHLLKPHDR